MHGATIKVIILTSLFVEISLITFEVLMGRDEDSGPVRYYAM
jgi:hypothetical protein